MMVLGYLWGLCKLCFISYWRWEETDGGMICVRGFGMQ